MTPLHIGILESEIKKEFKTLPKSIIAYFKDLYKSLSHKNLRFLMFQEEVLNPEDLFNNDSSKRPISTIADTLDRAENSVRESNKKNNRKLMQTEGYLFLISHYLFEKANSNTKQILNSEQALKGESE